MPLSGGQQLPAGFSSAFSEQTLRASSNSSGMSRESSAEGALVAIREAHDELPNSCPAGDTRQHEGDPDGLQGNEKVVAQVRSILSTIKDRYNITDYFLAFLVSGRRGTPSSCGDDPISSRPFVSTSKYALSTCL